LLVWYRPHACVMGVWRGHAEFSSNVTLSSAAVAAMTFNPDNWSMSSVLFNVVPFSHFVTSVIISSQVDTTMTSMTPNISNWLFLLVLKNSIDIRQHVLRPATAPQYLSECILAASSRSSGRQLRSTESISLLVPSTCRTTIGDRAFPVAAARAWNSLPQ